MTNTVINVQTVAWMQVVTDAITGKKYYMLGYVLKRNNTLAVTEKGTTGGTVFFCQKHNIAYPFNRLCAECQKQVVTIEANANVTACDTP